MYCESFWIHRSDFYNSMTAVTLFDSWEELNKLIENIHEWKSSQLEKRCKDSIKRKTKALKYYDAIGRWFAL